MATQQELSDEQVADAVYAFAAEKMRNGASPPQITEALVQKGLDRRLASTVVANLSQMRSRAIRDAAKKNMLYGGLWCVGGTAVTIGTYSAASGGGSYVVAWGAIVFGAIQFFRGVTQASH